MYKRDLSNHSAAVKMKTGSEVHCLIQYKNYRALNEAVGVRLKKQGGGSSYVVNLWNSLPSVLQCQKFVLEEMGEVQRNRGQLRIPKRRELYLAH